MSNRLALSALFLLVSAALPLASCGGGAPQGSVDTSPFASTCASFCAGDRLACIDPAGCTLADAAGTQRACVGACEASFAALASDEAQVVTACYACKAQGVAAGQCQELAVSCDLSQCLPLNLSFAAAEAQWAQVFTANPAYSAGQCTNGKNALGGASCKVSSSSGSGPCTATCCNGLNCTSAEVGLQCDGASPTANCTCTAGKNKGKTFQSSISCDADVWTECNL
jgi:hypothetical protein